VAIGTAAGSNSSGAYADALKDGFANDRFNALVYLAQTVPGFTEAMAIWRRNQKDFADLWTHSLVKQGIDRRYLPYLNDLFTDRLSPADVAYAIVRGIMDDQGLLPVTPPATTETISRFPVSTIDALAEAEAMGFDKERLRILVGRSGLSMAPVMAANAFFRGVIQQNDYYLAIAEGDLRNEWRDAILDVSRQILTAGEYAQLQLRGFIDAKTRQTLTAKHGMSTEDSDRLYNVLGRSIPVHQITTGEARGGTYDGPTGDIPTAYLSALQREDLRPEFYNLAYANRYTLPSGFQIKAETQSGDITQAESKQLLLEAGWNPHWAEVFSTSWAQPKASSSSSHVSKAQNQLWTATHKAYINRNLPATDAQFALTTAGVPTAQQADVLRIWGVERDLIRKELTVKQIVKAAATDPNYGTRTQKLDALTALGYSLAEAETLVNEG
jgi:hypothetical protein